VRYATQLSVGCSLGIYSREAQCLKGGDEKLVVPESGFALS